MRRTALLQWKLLTNENGYRRGSNAHQKCWAGLNYTYDGLHSSCVVRSAHDGTLVRDTVINRSFGQFFMLSGIVHGIRPVQSIGPFRAFSKCDTYHIHFQSPLSVEKWWGSTAINAESVISASWVLRTARVEWKVALLGQILPISGN